MKIFCLDKKYSTTRILIDERPIIVNKPEDKFQNLLFLPDGEGRKGEGGLRTKGYFKHSYQNVIMNDEFLILNDENGNKFKLDNSVFSIQHLTLDKLPLISIITVVFNGGKYLEKTIKSVINQTYNNIEYIIIDGGSTDNTIDIIKKYENRIDYWLSESDKGIYDAMNKGIGLAKGKWINFMNAGDRLFQNNTVKRIFLGKNYDVDFIYGDWKIVYSSKFSRIQQAGEIENLWKGMVFSHQSLFTRSHIFKKYKFNINNKIGADFEFIYNCYKNKYRFYNLHFPVAENLAGGLSDTDRLGSILSRWSTVNKFPKNFRVNIYYFILLCDTFMRVSIKKIMPNKVKDFLLRQKYNILC